MDLKIDPTLALAELQLTLFMAAITALVELAKTTDKDHIKLRALTEVARLCNPAKTASPKPPLSPRRGGSPNSSPISPTPHGTRSASDGPHAPATSQATSSPNAFKPVARALGSEGRETPPPRATEIGSPRRPNSVRPCVESPLESLLPLNRRQRRFLARIEANERERTAPLAS